MNSKKSLVACAFAISCGLPLVSETPSTDDLWDVRQGVSVVGHSPLDTAEGDPFSYDAANILGARNGAFIEGQLGSVVFADFQPAGFVHYVEWRTPAPVTVRAFRLFASGDANGNREFSAFRLLAKTNGTSPVYDRVLYTLTPSHPYSDVTDPFLLAANVRPTTAQEFRAEFVTRGGLPSSDNGPRVIELDGFSQFLDVQTSIRVSQVEICWDSSEGIQYQVEFQTDLSGGVWSPLGTNVAGNGSRMCVYDSVGPDSLRRFYRVRPVE